ncbi:hypothetical protein [Candidatus Parabeggiatoa sp. HSG14]|uniref:hypothetical protein n=1 Tax=Candidatus Parabeggiatoa sp. HSG14 TaxID=3055593 RepID=UPI0025A82A06|nr:hypothetical protein [Thiotrichales bacterium HSG14]
MRNIHPQSGAALIIFLTIFVLGIAALLLSDINSNDRTDLMLKEQAQTAKVLRQAKEALIGFAATYAETHSNNPMPGYLLCPDYDGDGSADPACSRTGYSVVGRFPWKTLGLPPLRDGSGECLWYAVSGNFKDKPKSKLKTSEPDYKVPAVTSDDGGLLIVKNVQHEIIAGAVPENRAIAIVFAPGKRLENQNRAIENGKATECGSTGIKQPVDSINNVANYLDHYNYNGININNATSNGVLSFVPSTNGNSGFFAVDNDPTDTSTLPTFINASLTYNDTGKTIFNDTLMLVTPKDFEPVYTRMDLWVAKKVTTCFNNYSGVLNRENFLEEYEVPIYGDPFYGFTLENPASGTYMEKEKTNIDIYIQNRIAKFHADYHKAHESESPVPDPTTAEIDAKRTEIINMVVGIEQKYSWAVPMDDLTTYTALPDSRFGRIPDIPLGEGAMSSEWPVSCFQWEWWNEWKEMVFYAIDNDSVPTTTTYMWIRALKTKELDGSWVDWVAGIEEPFDEVTSADTIQVVAMTEVEANNIRKESSAKIEPPAVGNFSLTDWTYEKKSSLSDPVLKLDGVEADIVVLVAGRKLATQNRNSDTDKKNIDNYLEGKNLELKEEKNLEAAKIILGLIPPPSSPIEEKFVNQQITNNFSDFNDVACRDNQYTTP